MSRFTVFTLLSRKVSFYVFTLLHEMSRFTVFTLLTSRNVSFYRNCCHEMSRFTVFTLLTSRNVRFTVFTCWHHEMSRFTEMTSRNVSFYRIYIADITKFRFTITLLTSHRFTEIAVSRFTVFTLYLHCWHHEMSRFTVFKRPIC